MSLRRYVRISPTLRSTVALRLGSTSHHAHEHADHGHDHHDVDHHDHSEVAHHGHGGHGHGGHGHGHGHEQRLLTKLPLGPKYPGGKNWGLFVSVDEDPTKLGIMCIIAMSTFIFFVYYYPTAF